MKFGHKDVPRELFALARDAMRERAVFTPEDIRRYLVETGRELMLSISGIESNHQIVAERVMRAVLKELAAAGEYRQLKRGVWAKPSIINA